ISPGARPGWGWVVTSWAGRSAAPALAVPVALAVLAGQLVEPLQQGTIEADVDRGQGLVELLGAAGADDGRGDGGVVQHPGHRQGGQGEAGLGGDLLERVDRLEDAVL